MSFISHLECISCKSTYSPKQFQYHCPKCQGFLKVVFDIDGIKGSVKRNDFEYRSNNILKRWIEFLPIEDTDLIPRVSLGESVTPMIRAERLGKYLGLKNLWIKNESSFPTGSLKDRSMPLVVLKAIEFGFDTVSIVSSGNAAASLSAYAARAGLKAVVFVAGGNSTRLTKCRSYGSLLVNIDAPYSETEDIYLKAREAYGWYDCNGLINPFRLEGKKTLAYEVCQALGWSVPDVVLMPTAFGNGLVSAWQGFSELNELGWVEGHPGMYAVQPGPCSPIVQAYESGRDSTEPVKPMPTVATAIAVGDPSIGGKRVLETIAQSRGGAVGSPDELTLKAQSMLAKMEGLFVEPSGATSIGAIIKMLEENKLSRDSIIVASVTGEGSNDLEVVDMWAPKPCKVSPDLDSIKKLLDNA